MAELFGVLVVKSSELWMKPKEEIGAQFLKALREKVSLSDEVFSQLNAEVIEALS